MLGAARAWQRLLFPCSRGPCGKDCCRPAPAVHGPKKWEQPSRGVASACPLLPLLLSQPGAPIPCLPRGLQSPQGAPGALPRLRAGPQQPPPPKNASRPASLKTGSLLQLFLLLPQRASTTLLPITFSLITHSKISQGQTAPVLFTTGSWCLVVFRHI